MRSTLRGIAEVLEAEINALGEVVRLLLAEQEQLTAGQTEGLDTLAGEKQSLYQRLAALADERNRLLAGIGLPADLVGLDAWAARTGGAPARVARLVALASEAREHNRINGQLITLRLNHTQAALRTLTGAPPGGGLYARDGKASPQTGYRLIDSA